jgi:hypothetical protein
MNNTTTRTKENSAAISSVNVELGKIGVGAIGITSALIGCWATACLVAGMISSGGPVSLVSNFVSAVIG